jgi:hypothetical protein
MLSKDDNQFKFLPNTRQKNSKRTGCSPVGALHTYKGHTLRADSGTSGDTRYSPSHSLTSALEGGERSASRPGRALPPGKEPPVPTVQEAGWVPEPV